MDKLLYITNSMKYQYGGAVINRRNYNLLHDIYEDNLFVYEFEYANDETRFVKLKNRLTGLYFGITKQYIRDVLKIIEQQGINIVFISNSLFSCFANAIRKKFPDMVILSFFHNVEYIYAKEEYKATRGIKYLLQSFLAYVYERRMIKEVDKVIVLNKRDAQELMRIYHRKSDLILPTSFEDKLKCRNSGGRKTDTQLKLLFVGSHFFANVHGILWFVDGVMPFLENVTLYIVGKDLEMERERLEKNNVQVVGTVDCLETWYEKADVVISPIFLGSGMKTKTAEALMYGKPILGTKEAFEGYDTDPAKVGALCNTATEFIETIGKIQQDYDWIEQHGIYARKEYKTRYDCKISLNEFRSFMRKI